MSSSADAGIRRVLVANRGEIAVRVFRACRELGISTVAIYGAGEESASHVRYADDAFRLPDGPGLPYLNIDAVLDIGRRAGADAVHPGYGFLAENAGFAEAIRGAGLRFIGPSADHIEAMGDKVRAREVASKAGIQPVPGTPGPVRDLDSAIAWAAEHGYPVAVKASGGGGGRGFRVARVEAEMADAFAGSSGEAERYFSNPNVYLERYLERPRHIEVQVFGDLHGNVVALGERDCSVQRRHQKLVEETPSPAVDAKLRQDLREATRALATSVGYLGAGTVEYLLDASGQFYFLEMNTRIQVEHTITEMVTGIDLVKEQIRVANGEPLGFSSDDVDARGWALECRINAEDPAREFAPVPGTISRYREPGGFGVRVDSAVIEGDQIRPEYDSLIAKLVTWGRDREEAIARMERALADFEAEGTPTTIGFHRRLMAHPRFRAGEFSTTFLTDFPEIVQDGTWDGPASHPESGRDIPEEPIDLLVEVNGRRFQTVIHGLPQAGVQPAVAGRRSRPRQHQGAGRRSAQAMGEALLSPIQGTVLRVAVEEGQTVEAGDLICVVEAMKMENELTAHRTGVVSQLSVDQGQTVTIGAVVATITDGQAAAMPPA
ncbi:MAG TPA: acetyl-CoA carboxylase biotin carboxylase subunit [Thermomicrobiales bacterium]|nr:acetyl-CoA carboxylase biotin carboxylase subunit [Thermomicrobiales bacterium]